MLMLSEDAGAIHSTLQASFPPKMSGCSGEVCSLFMQKCLTPDTEALAFFCMLAQAHAPAWDSLARFPDSASMGAGCPFVYKNQGFTSPSQSKLIQTTN